MLYQTYLGTQKFPFLYLARVRLLTPAQGRLMAGSVFAQDLLRLAQAKYHFRHAAPQHAQML